MKTQDPLEQAYLDTAQQLFVSLQLALHEPPLPYHPTQLDAFKKLDQRWYEQTRARLEQSGFRWADDVDGSPLTATNTHPSVLRVMLRDDGVAAGVYEIVPRAPNFLWWLVLKVIGRWPKPRRTIELLSFYGDREVSTMNGELSFDAAPHVVRTMLPIEASVDELQAAHAAACRTFDAHSLKRHGTVKDLLATRDASRVRRNQWRATTGLSEAELDRVLLPLGKHAHRVRQHLKAAIDTFCLQQRGV